MISFIRYLPQDQVRNLDTILWISCIVLAFIALKVVNWLRPWERSRPPQAVDSTLCYHPAPVVTDERLLADDWRERLDHLVPPQPLEIKPLRLFGPLFWRTLAFIGSLRVGMLWLFMFRVWMCQGPRFDIFMGLCLLPDGLWLGYLAQHTGLMLAVALVALTLLDLMTSVLIAAAISFCRRKRE